MAWRLLLWLPLPVLSQPPIANEPCFQPSRPACEPVLDPQVLLQNSSGLCPERVWPQNYWNSYWSNYSVTKLPHCHIPLEVRVGLTMSLSGPRSDPEAAARLLQMLVDQSYVHQDYCISFCVLDDESSPQRAAQLYRSFVGEAGAAHKVDILLGPATYDFRSTAAQVAQEFQEPLLLWSTMPALGRTVLSTTDMTTAQALAEVRVLRNLRRTGGLPEVVPPECGELCQVLQSSPFSDVDTCALLTPPAGRALRPLAKFLSCDGPCDPTADLDYCTRAASNLSVQGTWEPSWALPYGGWLDGCLVGRHWATANSATSVRLTLHFEESPTMTRIFAAGNGTLTHGNFTIEGRTISEGMWENQLLDGMELVFEYPSGTENDILWSICLAETCANFVCNASYFANPAAYCWGATCDPQADHGRCCTKQEADLTTFLGQDVFSTTFDLSVPPSLWMQDLLPRIFDDEAQYFVCVAQNDARGLFTDLCRFHLEDALSHGFRTLAAGPLTLSVDNAVADMLARLQHMNPSPQVVLLCADLSIFTSFIHAMITMQAAFHWVISAFPFDRELLSVVPAYTLFHNVLQSAPWPTMTYLQEHAQERSVCGSNHGKEELLQDGMWVQELYLASAGQLLDSVICSSFERTRGLFHVVEQEAPNADLPQIDSKVFFLYYLRYGPDPDAPNKGGFMTSLGQVSFGERGSRIQIVRGDVSSWRHETLPPFGALSETMSARDSWLYSQARYSISAVRSIETVLSPQLWTLGRKVLGTYPCPIGCRATNAYSCTACPPGYYRPLGETGCVPCTQLASDVFQDSWAGAMCFKCPLGAYCDPSRPAQEPVALPGYYRVENSSYMASFGKWSVEAACSSNSGLADLHAKEMSSWLEAKKNHRWLFQRCLPVSACLGNNLCFETNRGAGCASCISDYTKYESYFAYSSCHKCPATWGLVLQCFIPGFVQFLAVLLLARAGKNSASNRLSLAAPIFVAMIQGLQMHSAISKIMINTSAAREDLGNLVYLATWTEMLTAPCLMSWMFCRLPIATEADVWLYAFMVIVSALLPCACHLLLQLFHACRGRANRHTIFRSLVASSYVAFPNLMRSALEVTKCSEDPNGQLTLEIERTILCKPGPFEGVNLISDTTTVICIVFWIVELWLHWRSLKEAKYLHVQESFSLLHLKLIPSMWYWRFLDEFRVFSSIYWLSVGGLTSNFAFQVLAVLELFYSSFLGGCAPYTRMGADTMLLLKSAISQNLGILSLLLFLITWLEPTTVPEAALTQQPFLIQLDEILDRFAVGDILVIVSGLHITTAGLLKMLDNRGALSFALKEQTGTPSRLGRVLLSLLRGFPGAHSMSVHHHGDSVRLDTRGVPKKQRSKQLIGVANGLGYLFNKSGSFKINDVRQQVSDATLMVSTARKARFMIKTAKARAETFECAWKGHRYRGDVGMDNEKVLFSKLLMAEKFVTEAELSAAVEDMCDDMMMQEHHLQKHRRRKKKEEPLLQEEDEYQGFFTTAKRTSARMVYHRDYRSRTADADEQIEIPFEKLDVEEPLRKLQATERRVWAVMHEEDISDMEVEELSDYGHRLLTHLRQVQALQSVAHQMATFEPIGDTDALRRGSSMNFSQQLMVDLRAIKENRKHPMPLLPQDRSPKADEDAGISSKELGLVRNESWSESSSSILSGTDPALDIAPARGGRRRSSEVEVADLGQVALKESPRRGSVESTQGPGRGMPSFLPLRFAGDWSAKREPAASLVPGLDRLEPEDLEDEFQDESDEA